MEALVHLPFFKTAWELSAENKFTFPLWLLCPTYEFKGKFIFLILFSEIGHSDF